MIDARFRIHLPPNLYITDLSRSFPNTTFRLLSGVRTGDTASELGEAITEAPDMVAAAFREHEAVSEFEVLKRTEVRLLTTYETADVDLYVFVEDKGFPPEFPVEVSNTTSSTSPAPVQSSIDSGKRWKNLAPLTNSCRRSGRSGRNDC